jgi:hypothetical protein
MARPTFSKTQYSIQKEIWQGLNEKQCGAGDPHPQWHMLCLLVTRAGHATGMKQQRLYL